MDTKCGTPNMTFFCRPIRVPLQLQLDKLMLRTLFFACDSTSVEHGLFKKRILSE